MSESSNWFTRELEARGVSRRDFMGFCSGMAAVLALPEDRRRQDRGRASEDREADPGVAGVPGLLRQHRVVPARLAARPRPRSSSTRCRWTTTRRSWPPPATRPRRCSRRRSRRSRAATWRSSRARSRRARTAPTARSAGARHSRSRARSAARAAATIAMGTCATFGGLPAAAPNPTGALGVADAVPGRQEPGQPVGLPGQRREPDGADRLLPDLQALAAARLLAPAAVRLRQGDPRQLRAARALRRRPVRRGVGRRGPPHRLLPVQDGLQGPGHASRTARTCAGTRAPTGRSAAATPASAAPSPTSGTR